MADSASPPFSDPRLARIVWVVALGAFLAPVWLLDYFPTQDGPTHVAVAYLLKDYDRPDAPYREFFEIRPEPIPNWLTQGLLMLLMTVVPPLIAEKLLASIYIASFALGFRYFVTALRPDALWSPLLALPLAANRCLWMGFYNYCLGMALLWWILGTFLHRDAAFRWQDALLLAGLLVLAYFAHLMIFLLALGALALFALAGAQPLRNVGWLAQAAAPALALAGIYFSSAGFVGTRIGQRFAEEAGARLGQGRYLDVLEEPLLVFDRQTFGPVLDLLPWAGVPLLILTFVLLGLGLFLPSTRPMPGRRFVVVVGLVVLLLAAYILIPEHLGIEHGGYLKQRMPPLLWLLVLALIPEPEPKVLRRGCAALVAGVVVFHAWANFHYARPQSQMLADIVAAREHVGTGRIFFSIFEYNPHAPLSSPQVHAADYFALESGNVNLHNYQATTNHFPLTFRTKVRSVGDVAAFPYRGRIDTYVFWRVSPQRHAHLLKGFEPVHSRGDLAIWRKKVD